MLKIKINQLILVFLLLISLIAGIATRIYFLPNHFTHIDDIGVALTIRSNQNALIDKVISCNEKRIFNFKCKYEYALYEELVIGPPSSDLGRQLDALGLLRPLRITFFFYKQYHLIPLAWTYAPAQFYITQALVSNSQNYLQTKIYGRLPSLIFGLLCLPLMLLIMRVYYGKNLYFLPALFSVSLYSLSWEAIIYSAQMESYSIGPFAVLVLILLLLKQSRSDAWLLSPFAIGFLMGLLAMCQYQILLFLPGFVFAITLIVKRKSILDYLKLGCGFLIVAIPFVWFPMPSIASNPGINWNAGPSSEFAVTKGASLNVKLSELIKSFSDLPVVMESMLSPALSENMILATLLLIFFILGILVTLCEKNQENRVIIIFFVMVAFIWGVLLYMSKITFSPTRHSMVLIPLFIFFISKGAFTFVKIFPVDYRTCIASLLTGIWITIFVASLNMQIAKRSDLFDEEYIFNKLLMYKVNFIISERVNSLALMPSLVNSFVILEDGKAQQLNVLNRDSSNMPSPKIAAYFGRSQLSPEQLENIFNELALKLNFHQSKRIDLLYKEEVLNDVEIDWSLRTHNGTNSFFLYIFQVSQ